jgi:hypothetical protein
MLEKGMTVKTDAMQKEEMHGVCIVEWAVNLYLCGFFLTVVCLIAFFFPTRTE